MRMPSMFQIPALCETIATRLLPPAARGAGVSLARCLLDAGVIHDDVHPRRAKDPLATSKAHLQQWVRDRLPDLKCLIPGFRLILEGAADAALYGRVRESV